MTGCAEPVDALEAVSRAGDSRFLTQEDDEVFKAILLLSSSNMRIIIIIMMTIA